jgi:hypothetical protein
LKILPFDLPDQPLLLTAYMKGIEIRISVAVFGEKKQPQILAVFRSLIRGGRSYGHLEPPEDRGNFGRTPAA